MKVALSIRLQPALVPALRAHLIPANQLALPADYYHSLRAGNTQFLQVTIGGPTAAQLARDPATTGGVWLEYLGLQPKAITTSTVQVPKEVSAEALDSLNFAFTRLSECYEPWRKSHTGSIYTRFLYQERNNKWYPLEVLRNGPEAQNEQTLIQEKRRQIKAVLGLGSS